MREREGIKRGIQALLSVTSLREGAEVARLDGLFLQGSLKVVPWAPGLVSCSAKGRLSLLERGPRRSWMKLEFGQSQVLFQRCCLWPSVFHFSQPQSARLGGRSCLLHRGPRIPAATVERKHLAWSLVQGQSADEGAPSSTFHPEAGPHCPIRLGVAQRDPYNLSHPQAQKVGSSAGSRACTFTWGPGASAPSQAPFSRVVHMPDHSEHPTLSTGPCFLSGFCAFVKP